MICIKYLHLKILVITYIVFWTDTETDLGGKEQLAWQTKINRRQHGSHVVVQVCCSIITAIIVGVSTTDKFDDKTVRSCTIKKNQAAGWPLINLETWYLMNIFTQRNRSHSTMWSEHYDS